MDTSRIFILDETDWIFFSLPVSSQILAALSTQSGALPIVCLPPMEGTYPAPSLILTASLSCLIIHTGFLRGMTLKLMIVSSFLVPSRV